MELPEIRCSHLVQNSVAGIQTPTKRPRHVALEPHDLLAKGLQGLQVLERCRSSLPVGLAAGGNYLGKEVAIVPPGHKECQAQQGAQPAHRTESQLAILFDAAIQRVRSSWRLVRKYHTVEQIGDEHPTQPKGWPAAGAGRLRKIVA